MRLIKVKILDTTLEAALLSKEVAQKFDDGLKRVLEAAAKAVECESGSEAIEMQCQAVMDFIDELFGDGSSRKVFGDEMDLLTCLDAWEELTEMYETQVNPIVKKYQERAKARAAQKKADDIR